MTRDARRLRLIGAALIAPILAIGAASTGNAQPAKGLTNATATTAGVAGEGTWCNDERAVLPSGPGAPVVSSITVDGAANTTTGLTVQLRGVTHTEPNDLEVMLVGPTGQNLVLMSDTGAMEDVTGVDLTFSDAAGGQIPPWDAPATGTYLPSNVDTGDDLWLPPVPPDSGATELATFNGDDPNGTWSLYIADNAGRESGWIVGGWCLTITTDDVAGATATSLSASANPSRPDADVTFTATVTSGGTPVSEGSVTFSDEAMTLGEVPVDAEGRARFETDTLPIGRHLITAHFDGAGDRAASSRSIVHTVTTVADGMWCSTGTITGSHEGAAAPYPSTITVAGAGNTTTGVTVQLGGLNHSFPFDLEMMLAGPTGQSVVLMSDTGGSSKVPGVGLTFSDDAAGPIDDALATGTYLPTDVDNGAPSLWLPPAPPAATATSLAAFNGDDPNGTWSLYVADDSFGDVGWIDGGWCLDITSTDDVAAATTTALASSANPSLPGAEATFTATVTSGGTPVTAGTVTFSDGATELAEVPVNVEGRAVFTTNGLTGGRHQITARFDGTGAQAPSSRSITHTVTTLADESRCSANPIIVPDEGAAAPYASTITVAGAGTRTTGVTVELGDVNHTFFSDLQVMLVGPTGQSLVLVSGTASDEDAMGVDLTFRDDATAQIPDETLTTGTYRPTNLDIGQDWPPPAPADSGATELASFNGTDPNGTWSLYVADGNGGDVGWIGGWCVEITTAISPTDTAVESTPNPSTFGQDVTFTATVTSAGDPVTESTVTFTDGATTLAEDVALDAQGRAQIDTSDLTVGGHEIIASYQPTPDYAASDATLSHTVAADSTGPRAHPTVSPAPNAAGWHPGPVTVTWNWTDDGSGINPTHCRDQTASSGEGEITVTAICGDRAGNETIATHTVKVDSTAPRATIASPRNARYLQGTAVIADYTCRDSISRVAACTGTVADEARIDTSRLGTHRFTVTGRDHAGNQRTVTVTYTIVAAPTCHGQPATIVGTAGRDVITGTPGADVIVTGAGRDWVRARGGDDIICTGAANDVVTAGGGDDTIATGTGRDYAFGDLGDDTITGGTLVDILTGGPGADTLAGNGGNDNLIGHGGPDRLHGGPGTDTCRGGAGTDHQTTCELALSIP